MITLHIFCVSFIVRQLSRFLSLYNQSIGVLLHVHAGSGFWPSHITSCRASDVQQRVRDHCKPTSIRLTRNAPDCKSRWLEDVGRPMETTKLGHTQRWRPEHHRRLLSHRGERVQRHTIVFVHSAEVNGKLSAFERIFNKMMGKASGRGSGEPRGKYFIW